MPIKSQNPYTEEVVQSFDPLSPSETNRKIQLAQKTFSTWKNTSIDERIDHLRNVAGTIHKQKEELANLITTEMGKPIAQSIAEVEKSAWVFEYYAEHAYEILKHELIDTEATRSYVRFDPLGVILAVMPWNYPLWQVMRFIAPAMTAGNVGVLKHASNVPQCALAIERVINESGVPEGVFQTLLISSSQVEEVIRNPIIKAVTLTGSEGAGSNVAKVSGHVLKKTVLELGGSDPFIVLSDADIQNACEVGVNARLQNMGQSCIAAKRFIVMSDIHDEFIETYVEKYKALNIGDPLDMKTHIGPLSSKQQLDTITEQVEKSVAKGAKIEFGGKRIGERGYMYEPTILSNVSKGMPAYDEELFGPVAAIIEVQSEEEAIEVANDSDYGLGASIWTADTKKAESMAQKIESGSVFINSMVKSHPKLPFGGVKRSGYGRELSHYGLKEFVNVKTVWVE